MKITRVIFPICFFVTISANRNEEILCKARPGCQLPKCDPGFPSTRLNTNEYPITCVRTSVQDRQPKEEIEELKRQLESFRTEWEEMKPTLRRLKSKEAASEHAEMNPKVTESTTKATGTAAAEHAEMNPKVTESTTKATGTAAAEDDCRRREGLLHSGKCFTLPHMSTSEDMNYDRAVAECARHGALLAEIHNRVQQAALYDFAVTKIPASISYVHVWMGMEYKYLTSTLLYRSGIEKHPNHVQWRHGYPKYSSSKKYMAMLIRKDMLPAFGLWNWSGPQYKLNGVICEKET